MSYTIHGLFKGGTVPKKALLMPFDLTEAVRAKPLCFIRLTEVK
jgi:hypothetical protein